jgi:hypothetical protein
MGASLTGTGPSSEKGCALAGELHTFGDDARIVDEEFDKKMPARLCHVLIEIELEQTSAYILA